MELTEREALLVDAARAIVTTRGLCGNEREAAAQVFADAGVSPTANDFRAAFWRAEVKWRRSLEGMGREK